MADFKKDPDEIGALWMKSSRKGDYMTGTIDGKPIVCFRTNSENPKAPQWRVLKAKPKEDAAPAAASREPGDEDIAF